MHIDQHKQHGGNGFTEREVEAVNLAVRLMIAEGVLEQDN
jgi:hypothetical protein